MKIKCDIINNKIRKLKENNRNNQNHQYNSNATQLIFFKRVENITDISFTNKELELLNKGLKYNLQSKPKAWIKTLALKPDTAIRIL
jgi:hypothetical protein